MRFTNASLCAVLAAIAFADSGLTVFIAWTYAYNTLTKFEAELAALALFGVAAGFLTICRFSRNVANSLVIWWAGVAGIALGAVWIVEILTNNVLAPPVPARDLIDNSFWAVIEIITLVGALAMALRSRRVVAGVAFGAWSGLVSGLIACTTALALITFGMRLIATDPLNVAEWADVGAQSGAPSISHYFALETLAGAMGHLLVIGVVMGAIVGLLGGCAAVSVARMLARSRRQDERPSADTSF